MSAVLDGGDWFIVGARAQIADTILRLHPKTRVQPILKIAFPLHGYTMPGQPKDFPFMRDYQILQSDDSFLTFIKDRRTVIAGSIAIVSEKASSLH